MMYKPKKETVLVLDLDDTLYKEADYVLSGINHIVDLLQKTKKLDIKEKLLNFYKKNPKGDFLEFSCHLVNLPLSTKESLLWAYRTHYPTISLEYETQKWLEQCEQEYHAITILTDGRAITQRLKIAALGLSHIPAYVSEEWDSIKPDQKRFLAIQKRWPDMQYIYIADNPKKDFIAPNSLGWLSIGINGNEKNIYKQEIDVSENYQPQAWATNFKSIDDFLRNHKFIC